MHTYLGRVRPCSAVFGRVRPCSAVFASHEIRRVTRLPAVAMAAPYAHAFTLDNFNPRLQRMRFEVLGSVAMRAQELHDLLQRGAVLPFTEVIKANIGDGQAMGQTPITFIREVVALVTLPSLMDDPRFADDVVARAKDILAGCAGGSVGAYTDKPGIERVRRHVAEFITRRDGGVACDWRDVILSSGATGIIKSVLKLFNAEQGGLPPGVMVPIPQYPLYSSSLAEFGMSQIDYFLDEDNEWGLDVAELERALAQARQHCSPRAIVVINPGNPTGQVLSRDNVEQVIRFAHAHRLVILADEVYQDNVYAEGRAFHSFKRVAAEMGSPFSDMELASFMSCSKGYMGECGLRGGYVEFVNLSPAVKAMFLKAVSAETCPSTIGQAVLDCVVRPPMPGDASFPRFDSERRQVLRSLAERARLVESAFNAMDGVTCNPVQGAMYAFPKLDLPARAVEAARAANQPADTFYAHALLEATGICFVPGSGFGQRPGTAHMRTTILPQTAQLTAMMDKMAAFHAKFVAQYRD